MLAYPVIAIFVLFAPLPIIWWRALPTFVWVAAVASECWSCVAWWRGVQARPVPSPYRVGPTVTRRTRRVDIPTVAVLVLAGCDVAALTELVRGQWHLVHVTGWVSWGALAVLAIVSLARSSRSP